VPFYFAREAAGATGTRLSLRPLKFQMALDDAKLARVRGEIAGVCCDIRAVIARSFDRFDGWNYVQHNRIGGLHPSPIFGGEGQERASFARLDSAREQDV
jgi:hypothetical protein